MVLVLLAAVVALLTTAVALLAVAAVPLEVVVPLTVAVVVLLTATTVAPRLQYLTIHFQYTPHQKQTLTIIKAVTGRASPGSFRR